jgi:hypothetical protein
MRGYAASGRRTYTKFHLDFEMLARVDELTQSSISTSKC